MGFVEESFGCDFVSDGISDPVYKHAERPAGTGHSAFGDDRRFSGSAAGAAALGDPAAAVPIYPDGMFTFLGLCWKAGTAAEVIGIPNRSIGEHLYQAKIYLDTPGLFAWTAAIVYVSFCLEKAVLKGMDLAEKGCW